MHHRNSQEKISAMRINARNLRAKVRSMLPLDVCCKYLERNLRIDKLQGKKNQWQRKEKLRATQDHLQQHWCSAVAQEPCNFFSEKFQKVEPRHMFSKLTSDEIQQICDHKHYFVGEAHIADFDEFMQPQQSLVQPKQSLPEMHELRTERSAKHLPKKISETFQTIRSRLQLTNDRWNSTQSRLKQLKQEQTLNRDTQRRLLNIRLKQAQNNLNKQQENMQMKFELRRSRQQECQRRMEERLRQRHQNEQIEVLANQLKSIVCFHKRKQPFPAT